MSIFIFLQKYTQVFYGLFLFEKEKEKKKERQL